MNAPAFAAATSQLGLKDWRITRFQVRRDRVIGDSQVRFDAFHAVALELTDGAGRTGLGDRKSVV